MSREEEIKKAIERLIESQAEILGPEITFLKAREVKGITINRQGEVTKMGGSHKQILQDLISVYLGLSGPVVRQTVEPLLKKYPDLSAGLV